MRRIARQIILDHASLEYEQIFRTTLSDHELLDRVRTAARSGRIEAVSELLPEIDRRLDGPPQ